MKLRSTKAVIDAFGGNKKFAQAVDVTPQAVNNWRRKTFPANMYVIITDLLDIAGISIPDSLFAMKKRKRRR